MSEPNYFAGSLGDDQAIGLDASDAMLLYCITRPKQTHRAALKALEVITKLREQVKELKEDLARHDAYWRDM